MRTRNNSNLALQYFRMSDDRQNELFSLGAQKRHSDGYCEKIELTVAGTYQDIGSGLDTDDRPEFLKMVAYALDPSNNIAHIVFYDLSRYSRGRGDFYKYLEILDDNDIIVHSTVEGTSTDENADLIWGVKSVLNYDYSKTISRLTIRGQDEATALGYFMGRITPYGYEKYFDIVIENGKEKRHPKLKPHPVHSHHVRTMFEMRAEGRRPGAIKDHFNLVLQVPSANGTKWSETTIIHILQNNVYRGWAEFGRTSNSKIPAHRRKREPVVCENAHEPLVSEELFLTVQELMEEARRPQTRSPRSNSSPNPLSEKVKCGECRKKGRDSNMVIRYKRHPEEENRLICRTKKNLGISYCSKEDVPLNDVLYDIVSSMKNRALTKLEMDNQIETIAKESAGYVQEEKTHQATLRKRERQITWNIENQDGQPP